jgi:CRISPR-associated protein Csb1
MSTENMMQNLNIEQLLAADGPTCLIVKAQFEPIGDTDRFQPAGFPEMGHVIYDAPRVDKKGNVVPPEKVCIVDSAASMANHLETLCFSNPATGVLHQDLRGLPYVRCVTDRTPRVENGTVVPGSEDERDRTVVTTLTEGHRLASDYFLDGQLGDQNFRAALRTGFGIVEIKKDKTYFVRPDDWWTIYTTIFRYDPNSLVHGILFAKEQIKISRLLTAHLEAFGAARVGSAGVKFDRLGKTNSGQPIFAKDEETAERIQATFLIDLGLLRSYGHGEQGLNKAQKSLLLALALWKIHRLLDAPFRFRSGCHLRCTGRACTTDTGCALDEAALKPDMPSAIEACQFGPNPVTNVYYPATELFNPEKVPDDSSAAPAEPEEEAGAGGEEDSQ